MNILFISDFNIKQNRGGAQRSNEIFIQYGKSIGHNITEYNYDSSIDLLMNKYDILISSNLEYIVHLNPNVINVIANHPYHVRLEHDMNRYLTQEQRRILFGGCYKTVFLTEYHHKLFLENYGDIFSNVIYISDPIDTSLFYDRKTPRENKILYVGFMHELKGSFDFFRYVAGAPQLKFVIAGWGEPIFHHLASTLPNVEFLGELSHVDMPLLLNKYSHFMYLPRIEEPFCRSVAEALLCGMLLNVNDKIGCLHELKRLGEEAFRKACLEAHKQFWDIIV